MAEFAAPTATRLFVVLLLVGVLSGPAALYLTAGVQRRIAPTPEASPTSEDGGLRQQIQAAAAAAELVRVWSAADQDDAGAVKAAMGRDPGPLTLPAKRPAAPATVTVHDIAPAGQGRWTVTVATGGAPATTPAFFTVLVAADADGRMAVLTLPGRIAAATPVAVDDDLRPLPAAEPVAVAAAGFVRALLTGDAGDLARWLAPGSPVQPAGHVCAHVDPQRVETSPADTEAAARGRSTALVTVTCQASTGTDAARTYQYPVDLQLRDGRWEVTGYATQLPTPPTTTDRAAPSPATTASPR